jgi:hypothetical protein
LVLVLVLVCIIELGLVFGMIPVLMWFWFWFWCWSWFWFGGWCWYWFEVNVGGQIDLYFKLVFELNWVRNLTADFICGLKSKLVAKLICILIWFSSWTEWEILTADFTCSVQKTEVNILIWNLDRGQVHSPASSYDTGMSRKFTHTILSVHNPSKINK